MVLGALVVWLLGTRALLQTGGSTVVQSPRALEQAHKVVVTLAERGHVGVVVTELLEGAPFALDLTVVRQERIFELFLGLVGGVAAVDDGRMALSVVDSHHRLDVDLVEALAVEALPSLLDPGEADRDQSAPHDLAELLVVYVAISVEVEGLEQILNVFICNVFELLVSDGLGELVDVQGLRIVGVDVLEGIREGHKTFNAF